MSLEILLENVGLFFSLFPEQCEQEGFCRVRGYQGTPPGSFDSCLTILFLATGRTELMTGT